jgi:ribosomal protein L16 Arg81 hydroxylase
LVYRDPDPSLWTEDNITDAHIDQVQSLVQALANDRVRLTDWLARYVTRPKHETGTTPINEHRTAETQHARYLNGNLKE